MRKLRAKAALVSLTALVLVFGLTGCDGEDIDYAAGDIPLGGGQSQSGSGFTTPDDLGYTGEGGLSFDLDSPGNPNFDTIGNDTNPGDVLGVGDVGDTGTYNGGLPGSSLTDEGAVNSGTSMEDGGDEEGGEVDLPDLSTPAGEDADIPSDIRLPNTGIFLEDD